MLSLSSDECNSRRQNHEQLASNTYTIYKTPIIEACNVMLVTLCQTKL